jgi:hypothetical protein
MLRYAAPFVAAKRSINQIVAASAVDQLNH